MAAAFGKRAARQATNGLLSAVKQPSLLSHVKKPINGVLSPMKQPTRALHFLKHSSLVFDSVKYEFKGFLRTSSMNLQKFERFALDRWSRLPESIREKIMLSAFASLQTVTYGIWTVVTGSAVGSGTRHEGGIEAARDKIQSQAEKIHEKIASLRNDLATERMWSEAERMRSEAERMRSEAERMRSEAERMRSEAETMRSEAERMRSEAEQLSSEADKTRGEAKTMRAEAEKLKTEAEGLLIWAQLLSQVYSGPKLYVPYPKRAAEKN